MSVIEQTCHIYWQTRKHYLFSQPRVAWFIIVGVPAAIASNSNCSAIHFASELQICQRRTRGSRHQLRTQFKAEYHAFKDLGGWVRRNQARFSARDEEHKCWTSQPRSFLCNANCPAPVISTQRQMSKEAERKGMQLQVLTFSIKIAPELVAGDKAEYPVGYLNREIVAFRYGVSKA